MIVLDVQFTLNMITWKRKWKTGEQRADTDGVGVTTR